MNTSRGTDSDQPSEDGDTAATDAASSEETSTVDELADEAQAEASEIRDDVEEAAIDVRDDVEDHQGSGFAATALKILIFIIVIFGLSMWLVPMVAPHLPAGVARHLMPGQFEVDQKIANISGEVSARSEQATADIASMKSEIASLTERLAAAEGAANAARADADQAKAEAAQSAEVATTASTSESVLANAEAAAREASERAETATAAATEAGKVASAATRDTASLARRITGLEAQLATVTDEITAFNNSLTAAGSSGDVAAPELAAAFAALSAKVDGLNNRVKETAAFVTIDEAERFATQDDLRSARTALAADFNSVIEALPGPDAIATDEDIVGLKDEFSGQIETLTKDVTSVSETATAAVEAATAAQSAAEETAGKVDGAIRDASMRSAMASISSRLANGAGFSSALEEVASLSGEGAPEALLAVSNDGAATTEELRGGFGRAAQAAIAADAQAEAGEDVISRAGARFQSVLSGRPKSEQEGSGAGAILSRVEARLSEGALDKTLAEVDSLSEAAKDALGGWYDSLKARVDADAALEAYLVAIGGPQG